jgi:DNA-directed RNA polymerase specialized sigma24 family protein
MQEPRSDVAPEQTVRCGEPHGAPEVFEEAYLRFAPLLRKIAVSKFRIPPADAEPLVHDVFTTWFTNAETVEEPERYLIGGICFASRHYLRRVNAASALFCTEVPCDATPDESLLQDVERKILVGRLFSRIGGKCRDLLSRYYVNGETTEAIAGELRYKSATVLVLLSKCRRRALAAYRSMTEAHEP